MYGKNMKVRLVSYSQPAEDFEILDGIQDLIAFCAKVSNPSNQFNTETSEKLLGYLAKHKHWSPFEMASACLEITTTRDIARQILRHRSFSFQEFSQRYADPTKELEFVTREARLQDEKNRQNSIDISESIKDENGHDLAITWQQHQENVVAYCKSVYEYAIRNGIAKEQARAVLPEGLTVSRMYMNGTIRSWIHFIELRSANGTQKEHMEVSRECAKAIASIFPAISTYISK
jgi:thymidylate synthase (FAD)